MAAFRIGRSALKNAAELLTPLTTDQSIMVKTRAAVGLALVSDELASDLRSLVRTAATDKNPIVSAAAFDVLSHSGGAELLKLATAAFDNTQPMIVQVAALEAVATQRNAAAVDLLGKGADSDNTALAKTAIVGLGQLDAEPATAVLRRLAQNAEHPHRVTIAAALHRNDASGIAARFSAIFQEDASVGRDAIGALTELADIDATPLLIMALEDTDAKVRQQASAALTDSTEPDAVNAMDTYFTRTIDEIVEQLASGNRVQQTAGRKALIAAGKAIAVPMLQRIEDIDANSRSLLCGDIGRLKNSAVIPIAVERLKDASLDERTRQQCLIVLQNFPDEARSEVAELVASEEPRIQISGLELLTRFADDEAKDTLTKTLSHENVDVRAVAATGLAQRWHDEAALSVLKKLIKEAESSTAKNRAIVAMGSYPADTALEILLSLTESEDEETAARVVATLAQIKDKRAVEALLKVTEKHPKTAGMALYPLSTQNSADAAKALATFLDHETASVAKTARTLLTRMTHPAAKHELQAADARTKQEADTKDSAE